MHANAPARFLFRETKNHSRGFFYLAEINTRVQPQKVLHSPTIKWTSTDKQWRLVLVQLGRLTAFGHRPACQRESLLGAPMSLSFAVFVVRFSEPLPRRIYSLVAMSSTGANNHESQFKIKNPQETFVMGFFVAHQVRFGEVALKCVHMGVSFL